ncbi:protein kinase domain-containing protein [Paludisphaera borealis]|uniref:Serine/threonine-protein kinase PknB n=1 Tax=Paludisphaera borealis TaxID=1387353 RepID=A0A1U7CP83_9BACT|nr:protein kinase [Paludisphaera borealis]APW60731.1 Serine/threonine-protein kinase PknB [Paludisphaera borealis]
MSVAAWGRTWEDASTPSAARLTRRYEQAWRDTAASGPPPDPRSFLASWTEAAGFPGARLAVFRTDMSLRWEAGQRPEADWYIQHFPELGEDTIVALIYEEFCLREEAGETPQPSAFLSRYASFSESLRRVLDIHLLVGSGSASALPLASTSVGPGERPGRVAFPEAGQVVAGFELVEELGRGSFARVFLAREIHLADRLVALKLSLRGSREPQTLARLQHTHIVPVYSHRVDPESDLNLLCMPYFGRVTLAQILAEVARSADGETLTGCTLVEALDRLEPSDGSTSGPSTGRKALSERTYAQAVAWWGARLTEALGHAHDRGVLHRDVKPSNVLIAADGTPMLLDFNLAHESIVEDERSRAAANLGGTVDYMAPEHLEALAEARSDYIDARSDLYSMGVLLFEATLGRKPFQPPRKAGSIAESLLSAADARRRDSSALFASKGEIPAALQAVVGRCLAPDPEDRYQSAAELTADLQAVADDLPLIHAREPFWSRTARRLRRNRLRLAAAALILVSCSVIAVAVVNRSVERAERLEHGNQNYDQGKIDLDQERFEKAKLQFEAASQLARRSEVGIWGRLFRWRGAEGVVGGARLTPHGRESYYSFEELDQKAREKAKLADRYATTRGHAEDLHTAADGLRMRLIGLGEDLPGAVRELQEQLGPFHVLNSRDDWTSPEHIWWSLLDEPRRVRLKREVDELLFLWMAGVEAAFRTTGKGASEASRESLRLALDVCDRALSFAESKAPWQSLRERIRALMDDDAPAGLSEGFEPQAPEPALDVERSALACFQWGLLNSSLGNRGRARLWLQRAVRLEGSNYWYQFYLGFLEDQAGLRNDAVHQYSIAAALKPESPWVLFSRARLYRMKGLWSWAIVDLERTLVLMRDRKEVVQVRLELGYVHQALGDFARAREQYDAALKVDPDGPLGRAARLNLANIDAESGLVERAHAGYDAVLKLDPNDSAARYSRALLDLRMGRPQAVAPALDVLIARESRGVALGDLLATRAVVRMMLRREDEAVADATEARRLDSSPAHDRLVQRTLLRAGRYRQLRLNRPEELALFPLGGAALEADLVAAEAAIADRAPSDPGEVYRDHLTRAVILSALGRHAAALATADRALAASNQNSASAHLVAARVAHRAGGRSRAAREIERGLTLQPDEPGLLELRGLLRTESGHPESAVGDLDRAVSKSDDPFTHAGRAEVLLALRRVDEAADEWTQALRRDPELPAAYLGRARCYLAFRSPLWELALADLEHASSWAQNDLKLELRILATYARCLRERPDRVPRWLTLLHRAAIHAWLRMPKARSASE